MKRPLFLLLMATLAAAIPVSAEDSAPKDSPPGPNGSPPPAATNKELVELLQNVQKLHAEQHYFEALQELDKAQALAPDNPIFPNIRGSIYTAMREFDKARECFEESKRKMPTAFEPKFNLAELLYVQGKYPEAEAAFASLLKDYPKLREEVRHLTKFKLVVCRLKQDHETEAEDATKNFTFMDDTPAYYFSKAAIAYYKKNAEDAIAWLGKAQRIYKPQQNAPYIDTLMEAHWVQSLSVPKQQPKDAAEAKEPAEVK